jgi:hypothetical protein
MTVKKKCVHPEKYSECGLTVGLCECVQENKGVPRKDCEYCYGTGVSVYTSKELPTPTNCPHWVNDDIYVKGFRCSLYRDVNRAIKYDNIRNQTIEDIIDLLKQTDDGACPYKQCVAPKGEVGNCRECLIDWIRESLPCEHQL